MDTKRAKALPQQVTKILEHYLQLNANLKQVKQKTQPPLLLCFPFSYVYLGVECDDYCFGIHQK